MDSILTSIKKLLGIEETDYHFDQDIIMHVNSVLFTLTQIGVGPKSGFSITDDITTWSDYLGATNIEAVKSYIYMKVRLIFDPPTSTSLIEVMKTQANELEWRMMISVDPPIVIVEEVVDDEYRNCS